MFDKQLELASFSRPQVTDRARVSPNLLVLSILQNADGYSE